MLGRWGRERPHIHRSARNHVSQAATGYIQAKAGQTEERPHHNHLISREHFKFFLF